MTAMRGTPIEPTSKPAFLNASGIANIPVPIFPFSRWTIVSQFLLNAKFRNNNCSRRYILLTKWACVLEVEFLEVAFSVLRCHCGTGILHHQYYYCGKLQKDLLNLWVDLLVLLGDFI
jgi:hypothetical protein